MPRKRFSAEQIIGLLRRQELSYQPQEFVEQAPRHRNLGHLERDVSAGADDPGPNLHQLLLQRGQRPVLDRLRQSQGAHEVGEIVGQCMELPSVHFRRLEGRIPVGPRRKKDEIAYG